MIVKIFGERNTATNYLELLVKTNLDCVVIEGNLPGPIKNTAKALKRLGRNIPGWRVDESLRNVFHLKLLPSRLGWKHRMLPADREHCQLPDDVFYLLTTRDPLAWLWSMFKRPYNLGIQPPAKTFSDFLRTTCGTVARECVEFKTYDNPVQIWNMKSRALLAFSQMRTCSIVRHEDLVIDPETVVSQLANQMQIPAPEKLAISDQSTKRDGRTRQDLERVIVNADWLKNYQPADIEFALSELDADTALALGYAIDPGNIAAKINSIKVRE